MKTLSIDHRLLATIILALGAVGCASSPPVGTEAPSASPAFGDLAFTCGVFPFAPALLTAPARNDQLLANPAAAALRAQLAQSGPDADFLPDTGWTMVGMDASSAEFVTLGGDLGMKSVSVSNDSGAWRVTGWGDCRPQLVLPAGIGNASWTWGGPGSPGPDTQMFDALVTERDCASGQSSQGRIVGPEVVNSGNTVLVVFGVRSLGGPGSINGIPIVQTCQSNPSTRVTVDLGQPLGNRALLDGGSLPFADPATTNP